MMLIAFRSRLREGVDTEEYGKRASALFALAREMPGFRSIKDFTAEDGERLALIEFDSAAELETWRDHATHQLAQQDGRDRYYSDYTLQVCRVERESSFQLAQAGGSRGKGSE